MIIGHGKLLYVGLSNPPGGWYLGLVGTRELVGAPRLTQLGTGGFKDFIFIIFTPKIGEMIQFDDHVFEMGWFNHQLVYVLLALFTLRDQKT